MADIQRKIKYPNEAAIFYTAAFNHLIKTHVPYLRSHVDTNVISLDAVTLTKYSGDFYGLLNSLNIASKYHFSFLQVNCLDNPREFDESMTSIYVPKKEVIDRLSTYLNNSSLISI